MAKTYNVAALLDAVSDELLRLALYEIEGIRTPPAGRLLAIGSDIKVYLRHQGQA